MLKLSILAAAIFAATAFVPAKANCPFCCTSCGMGNGPAINGVRFNGLQLNGAGVDRERGGQHGIVLNGRVVAVEF